VSYPHSLNVKRLIEANRRPGVLKLTTFPTRNGPPTKFSCVSKPLYGLGVLCKVSPKS
jgi:hypothetical protein